MEGTGMQLNGHELEFATVKDLLRARAALGEKLFAIVADERLTYAGANDVANRIASSLHTLGVEKGDVVATYMQNSVDHICTWFACAKLGAVWAPLNIALVNLDLAYTIQNAAPRVLVVDDELLPNLLAIHDRLDPGLTIVVRGEADGVAAAWPTFEDLGRGAPEEPEVEVRPSDPAGLVYTGGSTGLPKGVLVSNLWYFPGFLRYREMFEPGPEDVHLGLGQMCHTIGSAVDVLTPLYLGMSTVLSRRFSASRFWEIARRHGTTITVLVGPLMTFLLNQPARPDDAENTIRIAGTATGQVPREVPVRFAERFDVDMLEVYGQTETGPLGCVSQRRDDRPYHSVGRPHGWAEVMIADADDRPCPPGVVGEIAFRSLHPHTFLLGYHRQPEKYAEACRNLWFHTGDLGHLDENGYLHFDGRQAHSIRRRGENIAAVEVEQALLQHPAIAECAVVGVPSDLGEEDIKAYLVLREGATVDPVDVLRFCEERIAYFKVPRYVELAAELPRSVTKNEIERYKLREAGVGDAWDREAAGYVVGRPG
jgi:crotonobetaine/carnitine-CoA ligase